MYYLYVYMYAYMLYVYANLHVYLFQSLDKIQLRGKCVTYVVKYWPNRFSASDRDQRRTWPQTNYSLTQGGHQTWSQIDNRSTELNVSCQTESFPLNLTSDTSYSVVIMAKTKIGLNTTLSLTQLVISKRKEGKRACCL